MGPADSAERYPLGLGLGLALGRLRKAFPREPLLTVNPFLPGPHQAGKFDIIPTMTTIGSGIGIFGVVSAGDVGVTVLGSVPPLPHFSSINKSITP